MDFRSYYDSTNNVICKHYNIKTYYFDFHRLSDEEKRNELFKELKKDIENKIKVSVFIVNTKYLDINKFLDYGVTRMYIDEKHSQLNKYLKEINLNYTLKELYFNIRYSIPQKELCKLKNLRTLNIELDKNDTIDQLPENLENLTIGYNFNNSLDNLPKKLKYLTLGNYFNQSVDNLPPSLESIVFGEYFNQPVDNLPINLKKIYFGEAFNQKLDFLPEGITKITFHEMSRFNYPLNNLPNKINFIKLPNNYNQEIESLSLTNLKVGTKFNQSLKNLPKLQAFEMKSQFTQPISELPSSLQYLELSRYYLCDPEDIKKYLPNLRLLKFLRIDVTKNLSYQVGKHFKINIKKDGYDVKDMDKLKCTTFSLL